MAPDASRPREALPAADGDSAAPEPREAPTAADSAAEPSWVARLREKESADPGSFDSLLRHIGDISLLDVRWLVRLARREGDAARFGGVLPAWQCLPPDAFAPEEQMRHFDGFANMVGCLALSYPWWSRTHPDPDGKQLREVLAPTIERYDLGFTLLLSSTINLHHFVLDGAIWKLRGRIADLLIRDVSADRAPGGGTLLRRVVWGACGLAVAAQIFQLVNVDRVRFAEDLDRRTSALDRLAWLGLDSAEDGIQHLRA